MLPSMTTGMRTRRITQKAEHGGTDFIVTVTDSSGCKWVLSLGAVDIADALTWLANAGDVKAFRAVTIKQV